ncbi:MAG TPA: type 4a pilus biogenesis protein PilO [Candidatus Paceibacterota bacterium]
MKYFLIIVVLVASIALFAMVVNPLYQEVKGIRTQAGQLDDALNDSKRIQDLRASLLERFNAITDADLARIRKVLPDNVDNVRLVLEISRVASEHGLILRDVRAAEAPKTKAGIIGPDESPHGTIGLGVTVAGPYRSFIGFLEDIEKGLRLVTVTSLSFNATVEDFNQYTMTLETYWLK